VRWHSNKLRTETNPAPQSLRSTRIQHVITSLDTGGAQMMLLKLLSSGRKDWQPDVVSLAGRGMIGTRLAALGIPVQALGMKRAVPNPFRALELMRLTRSNSPQLIQGWMYHGNLMASLGGLAAPGRSPVLWNIRHTVYALSQERWGTALVIRMGAALSRSPAAIIYNSQTSAIQHEALGYSRANRIVIPNGFDCSLFGPDQDARSIVRQELGLGNDAVVIGLIARYHPMKNHEGFLRAASLVARNYPGIHFLLAGSGVTTEQPGLMKIIQQEGLDDRVTLLGERSDVARLNAALDIACSASMAEGFSNAIGEAMASGVPCVVTDVGDNAFLIGSAGLAVPPGSSEALAGALAELVAAGPDRRRDVGEAARRRVEAEFSLPSVVRRYEDLYERVMRASGQGGSWK
jgi:glycosyltransferase involved in cell wall biosynthesis